MATILTHLIEQTNNTYYNLARKVGQIDEVVKMEKNLNDPIVRQVANAQLPLEVSIPLEHHQGRVHMIGQDQDTNNMFYW